MHLNILKADIVNDNFVTVFFRNSICFKTNDPDNVVSIAKFTPLLMRDWILFTASLPADKSALRGFSGFNSLAI